MVTEAVRQTLKHVVRVLSEAGVVHAIMGGAAVAAWRHARTTYDVDLLVSVSRAGIPALLKKLSSVGLTPKREPPVLVIDEHAIVQLTYEPPDTYLDVRVDLLLAESTFQKQALARRIPLTVPRDDLPFDVLACEDLMLFKLLAGRIIDRADVGALIRIRDDKLDWEYLRGEAAKLGLVQELDAIRKEALSDGDE